MSQAARKRSPATFKERAVKLAVEADQPMAQTVHALAGMNPRGRPGSGLNTGWWAKRSRSTTTLSTTQ